MMAKIVKGSDFKGAVDYIIDKKKDTQIVSCFSWRKRTMTT